jgi:hypothetical protein
MRPRCVTELFFLDEATALSAGHRPCPKCSHARFDEFKKVWEKVFGVKGVSASDIDTKLAKARAQDGAQRTFRAPIADLPGGVMIREPGRTQPLLVFRYEHPQGTENKCVYPWTSHGYGVKESLPIGEVEVLTPEPTVEVILNGFRPGPERPVLAW